MKRRTLRLKPGSLLLVSAVLGGFAAWRLIQRRLTPVNPKLALRYGLHLTRAQRRVLAVSAHQDDLELFAAGTLRLLALAGSDITVVVATGGDQQYTNERTLNQIREQEQRDAGNILGYDQFHFLHYTDLNLAHNPRFRPDLEEIWRAVKPDVVFAFDPTAPYRSAIHPDHLAVGRAVLDISRSLGEATPDVVFYGSRDPNALVDISQVIEDKTQAIRAQRSQLTGWKRLYNLATRLQTRLAGRPVAVRYAEPLRYLRLPPVDDAAYLENWNPQASRVQ
ncbi:MAG: PIG-L family deacetylase [Thermaerobacter sp.]|nr:PIG-L family deacetylase [Thermaerobacter sp.]